VKFDIKKINFGNRRISLPQRVNDVNTAAWNIYRTRFLIKAKQLTEPLAFVDPLGREHSGKPGDYLIESSDGRRSIQRREIFEDIYVAMGPAEATDLCLPETNPLTQSKRASVMRPGATA
jgi:hypothetical protein